MMLLEHTVLVSRKMIIRDNFVVAINSISRKWSWNSRQNKNILAMGIKRCLKQLALTPTHLWTWTENPVPRANLFSNGKFGKIRWQVSTDTNSVYYAIYGQFMLKKEKEVSRQTNQKEATAKPKGTVNTRWIKAPSWARKSHHPFCWIDNMWHLKRKSYECVFSAFIKMCCLNC